MTTDIDRDVERYIKIRDVIRRMEDDHKRLMEAWKADQARIGDRLQQFMKQSNTTSLSTKHGTCYTSTRFTASLADPDAFMKHVIETQQWDLIDRRANATAVKDYVAHNNQLPPGCNLTGIVTVGVRRSGVNVKDQGESNGK